MSPIALTSTYGSPIGFPVKKSQVAASNQDDGLSLDLDSDGTSTPYSSTSTAFSEAGDREKTSSPTPAAKAIVEDNLPDAEPTAANSNYFTALLASSQPSTSTKAGATVYGSAIDVLEVFAVQQSASVWVYDDAVQIGFGSRIAGEKKVHSVQTREGAGLELAGYKQKTGERMSVFATTSTLPYLLPSLPSIQSDIVIHLATTAPSPTLELTDSLLSPGIIKSLTSLPEGWDVIFSSGRDIVDSAAAIYGMEERKVIHVVESTFTGREITSFKFPSPSAIEDDTFVLFNGSVSHIYVIPSGQFPTTLPSSTGVLSLKSLVPDANALYAALTSETERKTVSVVGGTMSDADALKSLILATLYSASGSSKAVLPIVKSAIASDIATSQLHTGDTKTVSFFTAPSSPLPQLLAHLFLSSPSLNTRLAQFGSASARGVKSVLSLSPSSASAYPLHLDEQSNVVWVSDANVLKTTDVLDNIAMNGILALELPWTEEEIPVKLSRRELTVIKEKKLRVFLLDLDPSSPSNPVREQVAFLLLYTGKQKLPSGVHNVLEAFYGGNLHRDEIEDAQAGLIEVDPTGWDVSELEEGKVEKEKSAWEWDAFSDQAGMVKVQEDEKPVLANWDLAARHLFWREAFAVPDVKTVDPEMDGPGVQALRPSMADETFLVTVIENRRLTPMTYDRNVFHMELDSTGTGLKYEIGEAIGIHGWNDTTEVLDFCEWYGLHPDALVSFSNPLKPGTMETRTAFQLLQQNIDLFGRPGKAFYAALSKLATTRADAMTLKFISAPEGAELFKKMADKETVTFADVLYRFRTARPSIEDLVGLIPEIKPRHYSIASSQKAVGDKVELLIVTVDWLNSKGKSGTLFYVS